MAGFSGEGNCGEYRQSPATLQNQSTRSPRKKTKQFDSVLEASPIVLHRFFRFQIFGRNIQSKRFGKVSETDSKRLSAVLYVNPSVMWFHFPPPREILALTKLCPGG
jgi:hypothetical protein